MNTYGASERLSRRRFSESSRAGLAFGLPATETRHSSCQGISPRIWPRGLFRASKLRSVAYFNGNGMHVPVTNRVSAVLAWLKTRARRRRELISAGEYDEGEGWGDFKNPINGDAVARH